MRAAKVFYKNEEAGIIKQNDDGSFSFQYYSNWLTDQTKPAISLTIPKSTEVYYSKHLFPFFYNMLPEGTNKQMACHYYKIDSDDYFGLLMHTAKTDSIGAVTLIKID